MKALVIFGLSAFLGGAALVTPALGAENNNTAMDYNQAGMSTSRATTDLSSIANNAHKFRLSQLRVDNRSEDRTTRALNLDEAKITSGASSQ